MANGARLWVFQQMQVNSVLCLIVHNGLWFRGLGYIRCIYLYKVYKVLETPWPCSV